MCVWVNMKQSVVHEREHSVMLIIIIIAYQSISVEAKFND